MIVQNIGHNIGIGPVFVGHIGTDIDPAIAADYKVRYPHSDVIPVDVIGVLYGYRQAAIWVGDRAGGMLDAERALAGSRLHLIRCETGCESNPQILAMASTFIDRHGISFLCVSNFGGMPATMEASENF